MGNSKPTSRKSPKTAPLVKAEWNEETKAKMEALARAGMTDKEIAANLPVHPDVFKRWLKSPAVRQALKAAREVGRGQGFWKTYVVGRLSPNARRAWDRIHGAHGDQDEVAAVLRLVEKDGLRVRQELFLAALTHFNFKLGRACDMVGIRRAQVDEWVKTDPDFGELMLEVHEAKKDLFEAAFIDLIVDRNPAAVLFAARAQLADRGYNPKTVVETNTTVTHGGTVTVEQLDNVPVEVKQALLDALREKRGAPRLTQGQVVRTVVPEPDDVNKPSEDR